MTNRLPALGDEVRCRVSGFTGIVTSHARHIACCDRLWLCPRVGADGKPVDGLWIDIDMVEIVTPEAIAPVVYERRAPGRIDLPAPR